MLKVVFEKKGKIFDNINLSYKQLIKKLMRGFKLKPNNNYHLFYADTEKEFIIIQNEENYEISLNSGVKRNFISSKEIAHYIILC